MKNWIREKKKKDRPEKKSIEKHTPGLEIHIFYVNVQLDVALDVVYQLSVMQKLVSRHFHQDRCPDISDELRAVDVDGQVLVVHR